MKADPLPFGQYENEYAHFDAASRAVLASAFPAETAGDWRLIGMIAGDRVERELLIDPVLDYVPKPVETQPRPVASATSPGRVRVSSTIDPLKSNDVLRAYWEGELGEVVPAGGWVRCPEPTHEDRHPSCRIRNGRWTCWSCHSWGDAIDLASLRHGIPAEGEGYWRCREIVIETVRQVVGGLV